MKEKILDAAEAMVRSRGLNAVTFQELADAVGLRKPSLFHHVKNKEELTLALIDRCSSKHGPKYDAVVAMDTSAVKKLRAVTKIFEDGLKNEQPCLMAALEGGMESLSEAAADELRRAAESAIERFTTIFAQGREDGSLSYDGAPKHAAMAFFAMLQGLQTLCRAKAEAPAFKKSAAAFINSITTS